MTLDLQKLKRAADRLVARAAEDSVTVEEIRAFIICYEHLDPELVDGALRPLAGLFRQRRASQNPVHLYLASLETRQRTPENYPDLVQANLALVVQIARQYSADDVSFLDLLPAGLKGLERAAQKFDPSKSYRFEAYAAWWIRTAILQQNPSAGNGPGEAASTRLLREKMESVLGDLTEIEREILVLRFGLEDGRPRTLDEVSRRLGVTRHQIRRIEAGALRKLRRPGHL